MRKLGKKVNAVIATAVNCGLARNTCECYHDYCECGSSPRDYIDSDNHNYWADESNQASYG